MKSKTLTNTVLYLFFIVVIVITLTCLKVRYQDVEINEESGFVIVNGDIYEVVE